MVFNRLILFFDFVIVSVRFIVVVDLFMLFLFDVIVIMFFIFLIVVFMWVFSVWGFIWMLNVIGVMVLLVCCLVI